MTPSRDTRGQIADCSRLSPRVGFTGLHSLMGPNHPYAVVVQAGFKPDVLSQQTKLENDQSSRLEMVTAVHVAFQFAPPQGSLLPCAQPDDLLMTAASQSGSQLLTASAICTNVPHDVLYFIFRPAKPHHHVRAGS